MKKELAILTLAGFMNHAAADFSIGTDVAQKQKEPEKPTEQHTDPAIVATRGRKFNLAPQLEGTRERRRAAEAGAVIEIEIP